jgi:hypothetical protein
MLLKKLKKTEECKIEGGIQVNKVVIMYTPAKLYEGNLSGGVKRFLELYKGLIANEIDVILFSSDEHNRLHSLGMENRSVRYVNPNNKTWIPLTVKSFIWNYRLINEIEKMKYDSLIVFDVPTAIHFCLLRATHVDLFIRQDLISYKSISISERTKNKTFKKIYLKLLHFSEHICIRGARKIIVQCEYDKRELYKRHYNLKELLDKKMIVQINNVNPSWIVEKSNISVRKNRSIKFKICNKISNVSRNGEEKFYHLSLV